MSTTHASRPTRDKHSKSSSTEKMKTDGPLINKVQPTAEQMQLARMISNDNNKEEDPELMVKIKKVQELTHASEDDALFALYDVNYDLNRAVEKLLENSDIQKEWRKISKKEKSQQSSKPEPAVNNVKNEVKHEKSKDREVTPKSDNATPRNRRDRGPPRFQRGRGKERGGTDEEANKTDNTSRERSFDRGERGGRGRGRGGPGRGRGRGRSYRGARFDSSKDKGPHIDTWTNEQAETGAEKENIGSWGDMTEDWTTDDWQGSLEESKVFTPSNTNESSNIFSSMNDNDAKMFTPPSSIETQVFTASSLANSTASGTQNDSTNSFQHAGATHQQNAVSQGAIGHNTINQNSLGPSPLGQRLDLNTLFPKAAENSSPMTQQHAPFMSQFAKEATESIKNAVGIGSPAAGQQVSIGLSQANDVSRSMAPTAGQPNHQQTASQPQQQRAKTQRTKLPPPSKIPASAVEMPGSMNFQLDVQFGNWDQSTDTGNSSLGFGNVISTSPVSTNYASSVQSVAATKSQLTSMSVLDGLPQSVSQSSHSVYQNSTTPNPPKDYTQSNLKTAANSSTAETVFPTTQTDRKASPYSGQRGGQTAGSSSGSKPVSSAMTYSQSSYSCSYPSSYKPSLTSNSTYSHSANGLTSGNLSQSAPSQYNSSGPSYQSSTFQNQAGFSSNPTQSSLYQGSGNQSNAYSAQSGSTSSYSTGSAAYQGQGSYPSQSSSSYPSQSYSRDNSQTGSSAYQSGAVSQSTSSAYQSSIVSQSGSSGYQSSAVSQSGSSGYHSSAVSQSVSSVYQSGGMNQSSASGYPAGSMNQSASSAYQSASTSQSASPYPTSVSQSATPVSSAGYQRGGDGGQSAQVNYGHQAYGSQSSAAKLGDGMGKMSIKDAAALEGQSAQFDHSSSSVSSASLTTTTSTTASSLASGNVSISSSLGLPGTTSSTTCASSTTKSAMPITTKVPPNLPPGVPLIQNYMIGQPGIAPFPFANLAQQPMYSYEDLQLLQQRLPLPGYTCDMPLQPATTLTGRDQAAPLTQAPYSTSSENKMTRVDAQSPVTAQTTQQQQTPSAHQQQQQQQQQAFINATLPPGYNYYYPTGSVLPGGYSYPATMFPLSVTNTAHGGTTASVQFQKTGTYGTHAYGAGGQNQDFAKTYSGASSGQNKVSSGSIVSSTTTDLTGTGASYGKSHTQSFDKPGFHAGTPPPFNIPLPTGTQAGPMGGPTAYGTPYVPVMTHQPHSQMLHHPLQQDSSGGSGRSSQQSASQNKAAVGKGFQNYWGPN